MTTKKRLIWFWWMLCALMYIGYFLSAARTSYIRPLQNWDMLAYMGVINSYKGLTPEESYDSVMQEVRKIYSKRSAERIRRNPLSSNAEAFHQQLPLYHVKPLYTGSAYLLNAAGFSLSASTYTLSVLFFLAIGVLCLWLRPTGLDPGLWLLAVMYSVMFKPWPLSLVAALSTPDTMCIAFFVLGIGLWVYKKSFLGFTAGMLLAQLARPDTLLLTAYLTAYFVWVADSRTMTLRQGIILGTLAVLLYWLVNYLAGNYGWKLHFYYTYINKHLYPAEIVPQFSLEQYWNILRRGVKLMLRNARVEFWIWMSVVAVSCHCFMPKGKQFFVGLLAVAWLALVARFIFFPSWWEDRYYYPNYFLMLYAVAEILPPYVTVVAQNMRAWALRLRPYGRYFMKMS